MIGRLLRVVADDGSLRRCIGWWVVTAVLEGVGYILLVPLLDALLTGDTDAAWRWAVVMAVLLVVYGLVRYWAQMLSYRAAVGLSRGLFTRLGDRVAELPLGWFEGDRVGPVGRLTSKGVIDVMGVPAHLLRPLITGFVTPITVVVVVAVFDWRLGLAAVATAPLIWLTFRWTGALVKRAEHATHDAAADAGGRLVEYAQSQAVLRAHGRTVDGHQLLDDSLQTYRDAGRNLLTTVVPGLMGFIAVIQVAFTIVLFIGVAIAVRGSLDAAELIALLVVIVRSIAPLIVAADIGGALKVASNSLDRADELLATPSLPEPQDGESREAELADQSVTLDAVTFGYDDESVLHDLSIDMPAGSMTALVGPSGSGKTTVARLVARFWDVDRGAVRIGGVDVRELTTEALMAQVSIVFQETYLFAGTIADNLRLAKPDASAEDLDRVAELARLDEVIDRLPGGWDADVGEAGTRLSGGERQRVSIARALLKDAPIVLLDEATAAIDPQNELAIQNAIDTLRGERTIIVIAHRLATVVEADQIVVLDEGRIVERGRHAELVDGGGRYADFWNERRRAKGWRLAARAADGTQATVR
ncbi:MAG: ABC transporter ATP-binding protein [Actinomycetota bacterium]